MVIGIDIRSLQERIGGIPEYTRNIVQTLIARQSADFYILFANAWDRSPFDIFPKRGPRHLLVSLRYPNKLFHTSLFLFRRPHLDALVKKHSGRRLDCFFFPNIHFIAIAPLLPSVLTVHDLSFHHCPDLYSFHGRLWHSMIRSEQLIRNATQLCAVSHWTRHDLMNTYGIPIQKITVTPLDCAPECYPLKGDTYPQKKKYILLFGADNERKNAQGVLDAFRYCLKPSVFRDQGYRLVLIGRWRHDRVRKMQRHEAPLSIVYRESLRPQERKDFYARAAALLYPSITEGFGIPLVEAARMRVPIITANHSSIGEVIGKGAYYVDPFNSYELAEALETVLTDQEIRESLIDEAFRAVRRFSWQHTAELTYAAFMRAVT